MNPIFKKIAVLGSGTMGSQIAVHCANFNIPVLLFDIDKETTKKKLQQIEKNKPPALAEKSTLNNITIADYQSDLRQLQDCNFIIEAIVENIDIKKQLFNQIIPSLNNNCILASNTSGLSINVLSDILPKSLKTRFCGVHFFNPPRFLSLVEIIPSQYTKQSVMERLEGFVTSYLGKEVIFAKDVAGFIANRLGVISLMSAIHHADELKIPPDKVDVLLGKISGKASSGVFRTADIIGLDILKNVIDHIAENEKDENWKKRIKLPQWLEELIAQNYLGQKTNQGIYLKKGNELLVFDPQLNRYRKSNKEIEPSLKQLLKEKILSKILITLSQSNEPDKQFIWRVHRDTMLYAVGHLSEIAHSIADADRALMAGFSWKEGIFQIWQKAGFREIKKLLETYIQQQPNNSITLPQWLNSVDSFYQKNLSYSPDENQYINSKTHPVYKRQIDIKTFETLLENDSICLQKATPEIATLFFKTKLSNLDYGVLIGINQSLDYCEKNNYRALIFHSQNNAVFCAGVNLNQVLMACHLDRLYNNGELTSKAKQESFELTKSNLPFIKYDQALIDVIKLGQDTMMRLKHNSILTVAAVNGLALGGGCELILHCKETIATMNSYIGLVEVGVGILPAFGGSKEMLLRANQLTFDNHIFPIADIFFQQIAQAQVSSSSIEAKKMHYLKSDALIIANPQELLYTAIELCKFKLDQALVYNTSKPMIKTIGQSGKANILKKITNMLERNLISQHDYLILSKIAQVFSGEVSDQKYVSQQWLLNLEIKYFMQLLESKKSKQRIEYMLKNNKSLRN